MYDIPWLEDFHWADTEVKSRPKHALLHSVYANKVSFCGRHCDSWFLKVVLSLRHSIENLSENYIKPGANAFSLLWQMP